MQGFTFKSIKRLCIEWKGRSTQQLHFLNEISSFKVEKRRERGREREVDVSRGLEMFTERSQVTIEALKECTKAKKNSIFYDKIGKINEAASFFNGPQGESVSSCDIEKGHSRPRP